MRLRRAISSYARHRLRRVPGCTECAAITRRNGHSPASEWNDRSNHHTSTIKCNPRQPFVSPGRRIGRNPGNLRRCTDEGAKGTLSAAARRKMTAAMRTPDFDTTHTTSIWGEETMLPAFDTGESATSYGSVMQRDARRLSIDGWSGIWFSGARILRSARMAVTAIAANTTATNRVTILRPVFGFPAIMELRCSARVTRKDQDAE
jgi:hypothetical protein